MGKCNEAGPLLLAMHERIVGGSDASLSQTQISIERLVNLYESWRAAESGKGCAAKAAERRALLEEPDVERQPAEIESERGSAPLQG